MSKGKFIVFEGLDGAGTTTQARLVTDWLRDKGLAAHLTHEPSDGPAGLLIRLALTGRLLGRSGNKSGKLDERTLALFFAADRMDHLQSTILPCLDEGMHVISDRYYLSSFAYQSLEVALDWVRQLNRFCLKPDVTFLLDVPVSVCRARIEAERRHLELYEEEATLARIGENYHGIAQTLREEGETIHQLDGRASISEVHQKVVETLAPMLLIGS